MHTEAHASFTMMKEGEFLPIFSCNETNSKMWLWYKIHLCTDDEITEYKW